MTYKWNINPAGYKNSYLLAIQRNDTSASYLLVVYNSSPLCVATRDSIR